MTEQTPKTQNDTDKKALPTGTTADTQAAEAASISEGEVRAIRDDAKMNNLAGSEPQNATWESSDEGKKWLKGEAERVKKDEEAVKQTQQSLADPKKGLSEADKKYTEVADH